MASSLCKTTVLKVYQDVIEDVIQGVRELFLEDGVDEQVLQELKQTWEAKLLASKAVENHSDLERIRKQSDIANGTNGFPKPQQPPQIMKQVVGQVPPNNHVQTPIAQVVENKMVPIQITLPAQPGSDGGQRVLTIQVPASALQGNQLHKVLTGPVITATMSLPQPLASSVLQQHVNAALSSQQQAVAIGSIVNKPVIQTDGAFDDEASNSSDELKLHYVAPSPGTSLNLDTFALSFGPSMQKQKCKRRKKIRKITQYDGARDTSDEDDDASEDDEGSDEGDDDKDEDEQEMDEGGPEEEPLNSEDDVTDEDPSDLFDTENVVVCQYDKITRSRNKWKFHLKDGIMNLSGEDYVFQKANGDAEW